MTGLPLVDALLYALAAGAANVVGALAVTTRRVWSVRALEAMVALSAGFMLSVAFADLLPEAIERLGHRAALVALAGYLLVHLTQHTFAAHFHFGEETHEVSAMVSVSALVGLLLHTFVDGVAIASGFLVSEELGVLVFLAVLLHKLPEGVTIASVMLAGGRTRWDALAASAVLGAATVLGVVLTEEVGPLARHGLALSAGVTLYVAASNLVPEFQAKRGWLSALAFFGGALGFLLTERLLGAGS